VVLEGLELLGKWERLRARKFWEPGACGQIRDMRDLMGLQVRE